MKTPKVSVVVSTYNLEAYVKQSLLTIQEQSYKDFECIIVDDGSTDKTRSIVKQLIRGDKRFRLIAKENGGVSTARNAGFDRARGEYVIFLDGDDYFDLNMLEKLVEKAETEKADITVCNFTPFYDSSKKMGEKKIDFSVFRKYRKVSYESHPNELFDTLTFMFWNKLIRTDFLKKNDLRNNENLHRAQDIDFFGRALVSTKDITYIDDSLVFYRTDMENSNVKRLYKYPMDVVNALTIVKKYLEDKGLYATLHDGFVYVSVEHLLANLYFTETYAVHKDIYKSAKKLLNSIKINKLYTQFDQKTADATRLLIEGTYEEWLRSRIIDLRDDRESKYISYLLDEFQRKYSEELAAREVMLNSFSWKITRPIRTIKRFIESSNVK